jgi:hypothetical protein
MLTDSRERRYIPLAWIIVLWAFALSHGMKPRSRMTSTEYFAFLAMTAIVLGPYLIYEARGVFAKVLGWAITVPSVIVLCYFALTFQSFTFPHWQTQTSNWSRDLQIASIGCQLFVLLLLLNMLLRSRFTSWKARRFHRQEMRDESTSIVVPKEGKTFVDLTPEQLIAFYKDNTGIQADKLVAASIDKWMPLHGRLGEVLGNPKSVQVTFTDRGVGNQVFMLFRDQEQIDRLSTLKRGTRMTIYGQIKSVDMLAVHLDNCILVEVKS